MKNDNLLIGKIKSCQKWEGYLVIIPLTNFDQRFFDLNYVLIEVFGDFRKFFIEEISYENKDIYVKFLNFEDSGNINFLIGKDIYTDSSNELFLQKDSYFIHDLIGCSVYKGKLFIGTIVNVFSLPANDVYLVKDEKGIENLIPAVKNFIQSIDIRRKNLILSEDFELSDD